MVKMVNFMCILQFKNISLKKKHWSVLQYGWTSETLYEVKEAIHKRPQIVWFHLYEISRIVKSLEAESTLMGTSGWGREWAVTA